MLNILLRSHEKSFNRSPSGPEGFVEGEEWGSWGGVWEGAIALLIKK